MELDELRSGVELWAERVDKTRIQVLSAASSLERDARIAAASQDPSRTQAVEGDLIEVAILLKHACEMLRVARARIPE